MHVEIEKPKLNPIHFAAIIAGALVNAFLVGGAYVSNNRDIGSLREQIQQVSSDSKEQLSNMQKDISQIQPLTFQTTRALETASENKKGIENVNTRIDRVVESFGGKLDSVIESVNKISTQVQVLSSKLDDMQGKSEHTLFRMPVTRP